MDGRIDRSKVIQIVRGTLNDCPAAVSLGIRLAAEEGLPIRDYTYLQLLSEMASDMLNEKRHVWLAVDSHDSGDRSIVGIVQLKEKLDPFYGRFYEVGSFYICPDYRNRKLGRRLLVAALADTSEDLPVVIVSASPELRRSYKKMGFKPVATMCMAQGSEIRAALRGSN